MSRTVLDLLTPMCPRDAFDFVDLTLNIHALQEMAASQTYVQSGKQLSSKVKRFFVF